MRFVWIISAFAALTFAAPASAQQGDQQLRQQFERLVAAYEDAENKMDAAAIPGFFSKDGEFVSPFSQPLVKKGPQEIEKAYEEAFKSLKNRHIEIKLDQVSPLGSDVALAVGNFHITGEGPNSAPVTVDGDWTSVNAKSGDTWKIRMLTVFTPPPPPPPPAK